MADKNQAKAQRLLRRKFSVRNGGLFGSPERPRLSVFRSGKHIYAQIIDDAGGKTVAAASTLGVKPSGANVDAAAKVGETIAAAAKKAGVTAVVFDRGGYLFHGRVKALADAAREGGLEF